MNHNERTLGLLNTSAHDAKISLEQEAPADHFADVRNMVEPLEKEVAQ